jgi:hypothetical protein
VVRTSTTWSQTRIDPHPHHPWSHLLAYQPCSPIILWQAFGFWQDERFVGVPLYKWFEVRQFLYFVQPFAVNAVEPTEVLLYANPSAASGGTSGHPGGIFKLRSAAATWPPARDCRTARAAQPESARRARVSVLAVLA